MRSWLRWLLVVSVLSSALALWWPDNVTQAISRSEAAIAGSQAAAAGVVEPSAAPADNQPAVTLPQQLSAVALGRTAFDPFVGVQPPPPPPPKPVPTPVVVATPPPAPTAPPLTYRYLGRDERLTITEGVVAQEVLR